MQIQFDPIWNNLLFVVNVNNIILNLENKKEIEGEKQKEFSKIKEDGIPDHNLVSAPD